MIVRSRASAVAGLRAALARCALDIRSLAGTTDYRRFVVVGTARTGSTLLTTLLNAHSQALCFGEILRSPDTIGWDVQPFTQFRGRRLLALYRSDPRTFLRRAVFRRWPRDVKAVGFKLFYYHAREAPHAVVWDDLARDRNIVVLHIRRRNILAQYVSLHRAHATNVWSSVRPVTGEEAPVRLEVEGCRRHFHWVRDLERQCTSHFGAQRVEEIFYEDLVADRVREMGRVQSVLGLRHEVLSTQLVRQRRVPLASAIANYRELEAAFAGTEWGGFFTEAFA